MIYKWEGCFCYYIDSLSDDIVSRLKDMCRKNIMEKMDSFIWYPVEEIEDLEYDEIHEHYRYELKIKFGRYKDE